MSSLIPEDEMLTDATRAALHRILDRIDAHIEELRDVIDSQDVKLEQKAKENGTTLNGR